MDFTKEFKLKGKWWTPDKEKDCLYGEISYDLISGIKLKVYGSFISSKNIFTSKSNFLIPNIRGRTRDGNCITLLNSFGHETGSNHLLETTLNVEYLISNESYYLEPAKDQFEKIFIYLNCNDAFFSRLYKHLEIDKFDKEGDLESLRYIKTPPKQIFRDDNVESFLLFDYGFNYSTAGDNEFKFSQKVFINSTFKNSSDFNNSIQFSKNLKSLFIFFTENKVFFNNLRLKVEKSEIIFDVIFNQPNRKTFQNVRMIDLLCRYDDFNGSFENAFSWFMTNRDFVENGLNLYLQLRELKIESIPQQFLSIVFALETLHTTFFSEKPFTDDEYDRFKKQKKACEIDEQFKNRFNECLAHFNSQSFANRIYNLIERNWDLVSEYIYDKRDFVLKLKKQRNYFAHDHTNANTELIKQDDFGYFIQMCQLIYDANFLNLIGVGKNVIEKCIKSSFFNNYFKKKMPSI
jgi:ApeA N-terminal domain 1/Apea-like HEPN